jgi:hypothetical protein
MRIETRNRIEDKLIVGMDAKKLAPELRGQGGRTEQFVESFYESVPGLKARAATAAEDAGGNEGQQTVDVVVSFSDGRHAFAVQVTGNSSKEIMKKKLEEMSNRPFVRLPDTLPNEPSIPKVLVFLDPLHVKKFFDGTDPTIKATAKLDLMIKVIDDHIRSFTFDLAKTKNPAEQAAVKNLIAIFTEEKKKYIQ